MPCTVSRSPLRCTCASCNAWRASHDSRKAMKPALPKMRQRRIAVRSATGPAAGCATAAPAARRPDRRRRIRRDGKSRGRLRLRPMPMTAAGTLAAAGTSSTRMPASLRPAQQDVIGPLERDARRARRLQRPRHGDADRQAQAEGRGAKREETPQQGEGEAALRRQQSRRGRGGRGRRSAGRRRARCGRRALLRQTEQFGIAGTAARPQVQGESRACPPSAVFRESASIGGMAAGWSGGRSVLGQA